MEGVSGVVWVGQMDLDSLDSLDALMTSMFSGGIFSGPSDMGTCHPGVAEDFLSGARFEISKWGKAERSAAEL